MGQRCTEEIFDLCLFESMHTINRSPLFAPLLELLHQIIVQLFTRASEVFFLFNKVPSVLLVRWSLGFWWCDTRVVPVYYAGDNALRTSKHHYYTSPQPSVILTRGLEVIFVNELAIKEEAGPTWLHSAHTFVSVVLSLCPNLSFPSIEHLARATEIIFVSASYFVFRTGHYICTQLVN